MPEKLNEPHSEHAPIWHVIKRPEVTAFLVIIFLMLCSHGPYYTFYTIYLGDLGYSSHMIGILWAVGVMAEVIVFLLMHRMLPKFGARGLLLFTLLLTTLRWLMIGFFAHDLTMLFLAQLIHAFSFGVFHAVGISLVHVFFTGSHQGRGQALRERTTALRYQRFDQPGESLRERQYQDHAKQVETAVESDQHQFGIGFDLPG